jgi:hypothetical protein
MCRLEMPLHRIGARRISVHVRDAVQLEAFLTLPPAEQQAAVLTLDRALPNLTKIEATPDLLRAVANGIAIRGETVYGKMPPTLKKGTSSKS